MLGQNSRKHNRTKGGVDMFLEFTFIPRDARCNSQQILHRNSDTDSYEQARLADRKSISSTKQQSNGNCWSPLLITTRNLTCKKLYETQGIHCLLPERLRDPSPRARAWHKSRRHLRAAKIVGQNNRIKPTKNCSRENMQPVLGFMEEGVRQSYNSWRSCEFPRVRLCGLGTQDKRYTQGICGAPISD